MKLSKKMVTIVATAAVALAGVGVLVYVILNDKQSVDNPGAYYGTDADGFSANVKPDEHIGTINVVDKSEVEAVFGEGVTVSDPRESGTVNLGTTKSETVTFDIKSEKGKARFEVDVRTYATEKDLKQASPFLGAQAATVEGVGTEAHYLVPFGQNVLNEQQVALIATEGKTSYKFALVQASDNIFYNLEESKQVVLDVAKKASLSEVK